MTTAVPAPVLRELARTEGSPQTLAHLVHDQSARRLLLLRALYDTLSEAPAHRAPAPVRERAAEDWAVLEAAEATGPQGAAQVRGLLQHPLGGPWARQTLAALTAPRAEEAAPELARGLAHFAALATAAALAAGLERTVTLTAYEGLLVLPGLGALRTATAAPLPVTAETSGGALRLTPRGAAAVTVFPQPAHGAWSADPAWLPAHALPPLLPGAPTVPLDDIHPYRQVPGPRHRSLSEPVTLDDQARKRWYEAWSGTAALLALGGPHRTAEAVHLLRSLVPLASPPAGGGEGEHPGGSCSGTRKEAFGVVLASVPPSAAGFAALLVHELQHAKLAALCELTPLHHAGHAPVHFAPWRPDARPFDGLLQGVYSHLALAQWWQRYALAEEEGPAREHAWVEHARCREQVGAALPALVNCEDLTPQGRQFVDGLVGAWLHMTRIEPPPHHLARARAYVDTARALWRQRRASG